MSHAQDAALPGKPATPATTASPTAPALDATKVAGFTGGKPESSDGIVKVSFPRSDVTVDVDGYASMPPFMGLTSWAAFQPGSKPDVEAMVMGDLVVFEDEVSVTMSAALDHGLQVTALHNHFLFAKPAVFFMHIGGEGSTEKLGTAVRAALDAQRAVRVKSPRPAESSGRPLPAGPSHIDPQKLDAIFGRPGQSKDGMYKVSIGRQTTASCGCTVGKAMGVNTWAAFAGTDDDAVVDGDFAASEAELQAVLKALRAAAIDVVAIHSHMTGESPRILFLHYWGRGKASELAKVVKTTLDLTAWEGRAPVAKQL